MNKLIYLGVIFFIASVVLADSYMIPFNPRAAVGCSRTWYEEGFGGSGEISGITNWTRIRTIDNTIEQVSSQAQYTKIGTGFRSSHVYKYNTSGECDADQAVSIQAVDAGIGSVVFGMRVDGNDDGYRVDFGGAAAPTWGTQSFNDGASFVSVDSTCNESYTETIAANDYVGAIVTGSGTSTVVVFYDFDATVPSNNPSNWPGQAATGGTCTFDADPGTVYNSAGDLVLGLGGNTGSPWQVDNFEGGDN